ncbi:T9SS type A sorting domain-containing protein [bacterium]|nr:T9SS type A sorting domain-containing protein [bacterium]
MVLSTTIPAGAQEVLDIWDLDAIMDTRWLNAETLWTADTSVLDPIGLNYVNLSVGKIEFSSFGGDSGVLRIQAYFAYPAGGTDLTALVIGHGILMGSSMEWTEIFAAAFGCYALGISGPGYDESEGAPGYDYPQLLNAYPNPRNSHLYQFGYAMMRGFTYMESLPMINPDWMGTLGFSSGADAALLANGVDPRCALCVAIIPQTDFECGAADSGWMVNILEESGLPSEDSSLYYMQRYIAPVQYTEYFHGFNVFICGSQDEFEPLNCLYSTYTLLDSANSRLEIVGNFDHHCYFTPYGLTTDYDCFDNTITFYSKILGTANTIIFNLRHGIRVPQIPTVTATIVGDSIEFIAEVPPIFLTARNVKLWISTDSAWTFNSITMDFHLGLHSYFEKKLPNTSSYSLDNLIYYVEARSGGLWLSSVPHVPPGQYFNIRPFPRDFFTMGIEERSMLPPNWEITAYPNPFNTMLKIGVANVRALHVTPLQIEIFDIKGKKIFLDNIPKTRYLIQNSSYEFTWQPTENVGSGIYFIRVHAGSKEITRRVVYLK